jgi:hypothetical protein
MNSLSWLIYLAGVTGTLGNFLTFITVIFGVLAGVSMVVWLTSQSFHDTNGRYHGDAVIQENLKAGAKAWRWFWGFLALMISFGSVSALMPSRQTVLLIAASQMGEQVLNHPRINQVVDPGIELLTTWMQKETADLRRASESNNRSR